MSFNDKITYDVEMTTANMLRGEAVANKTISGIIKKFDLADKAVRDFESSQRKLGNTVNAMGQVINKNGSVIADLTHEYRRLAKAANESFNTVNTQINGVAGAVNGQLNQALTNTSYQIQDIAVQLAGGQNPFLVMAQQIPQLLVGFGALAAGIGAAVAVLGGLYLAFGDSASNAEKLEKAIEQVKAVMTIGADGVANYSDELKELNSLSESLVKLKLGLAVADQNKAINLSLAGLKEALDDTRGSFDTYSDQVTKVTGVKAGADAFKEAELAFRGYSSAIAKFNADGDVDQLESSLTTLANSGANNTEKGRELIRTTIDMIAKFRQGKLTIDALKESMGGLEEETTDAQNSFTNLIQSLILQREELVSGERAALALKLQMDGLSESEARSALAIYDNNEALRQQKEEAEQSAKAIKELNDDLDAFFAKESADSTRKDQQQTATLTRQVQTIGLTPEQEIQARYDRELEILRQHKEKVNDVNIDYAEREKEIQRQKTESINRLNNENELRLTESYRRIGDAAAASIGNYLAGVEDGEMATRRFKAAIIQEAVGALITLGTQALTQMLMTKTASKVAMVETAATATATTATTTAAQTAATATVSGIVGGIAGGLATAWAPAAAFASLATLGTNAAPAIAGIVSTMGATLAAQAVGGLASSFITAKTGFSGPNMNYGGQREFGGPVSAGSMYRVGEKGNPEFFKNKSGQLSMIPGENGEVIPANKLMGGGVTVNVYGVPDSLGQPDVIMDKVNNAINLRFNREIAGMRDGTSQFGKAMKASGNYKNRASS